MEPPSTTTIAAEKDNSSAQEASSPTKRPASFPPEKPSRKAKKPRMPVVLPSWNDMLYQYILFQAHEKSIHQKKIQEEIPDRLPVLQSFVESQRKQYHSQHYRHHSDPWALNEHRVSVLEFSGFLWRKLKPQLQEYKQLWQQRFQELVDYKKVHGHCNVPQHIHPLGKWVKSQREGKKEAERRAGIGDPQAQQKRKKSTTCLSQERIDKLNTIGFVWQLRGPMPNWEERYQQLIEYKTVHGDTLVPQNYPPDATFGKWVMKQRCEYSQLRRGKKSFMTEERIGKLEAIGFQWVSPRFHPPKKNLPQPPQPLHQAQLQRPEMPQPLPPPPAAPQYINGNGPYNNFIM